VKLGIVSLGCDKATVDSERLVGELVGHGAEVVRALDAADVILVNTCGFIDAAKRESIEAILEAAALKRDGRVKAVVAAAWSSATRTSCGRRSPRWTCFSGSVTSTP
jgi:ribosomal protein S12 methylthiotransferase